MVRDNIRYVYWLNKNRILVLNAKLYYSIAKIFATNNNNSLLKRTFFSRKESIYEKQCRFKRTIRNIYTDNERHVCKTTKNTCRPHIRITLQSRLSGGRRSKITLRKRLVGFRFNRFSPPTAKRKIFF